MSPVPDDAALLSAWAEGDKRAGGLLFDRHFSLMSRFFANKAGEAADDLIQQTFLGCVEARGRFSGASSFRAFLFGIARNVLFNHYRTCRGRREDPDFSITSVAELAPSAGSLLAARGDHRMLLEALRQLPVHSQVILELVYWERMKATDIAVVVELPEGTVRSRLRKAKQELAQQMRRIQRRPEPLESTIARLDDWAQAIRASLPNDTSSAG